MGKLLRSNLENQLGAGKITKSTLQQAINSGKTPSEMGYRMPAEWEPQLGIWLSWPHNFETFEKFLPQVEESYGELIKILTQDQLVYLLVTNKSIGQKAQKFFS